MKTRATDIGLVVKTVGRAALADQVTFLAASIAFYAFISVFPLLLLVLVLGSYVGGEAFAMSIVNAVEGVLTPESQGLVEEALVEGTGRGGAGAVGAVALLWSGLKVFRGLDIAFSQVYGTGEDQSFVANLASAGTVLLAIGVGFAVMLLVRTYVRLVPTPPLVGGLSIVLVFLALVVVFFPMYYVFPSTSLTFREVIPGAVFAGASWTVLSELFGLYAANAGTFALFGFLGAVLLLLTWFYFGAIILLVGATLNAVLAGRYKEEAMTEGPGGPGPIGPDAETYRTIQQEERAIGEQRESRGTGAMPEDSQNGSDDPVRGRDDSSADGVATEGTSAGRPSSDTEVGRDAETGRDAEAGRGDREVRDAEAGREHREVRDAERRGEFHKRGAVGARGDDVPTTEYDASTARDRTFEREPPTDGTDDVRQAAEPAADEPAADAPTLAQIEEELYDLRGELSRFELAVEERTVKKPALESELKRYVRGRMRRNRARGWGPYIVLLYGTGMTLGAFYFLAGGWAILAMLVVWLSTLGLYVVMVAVGAGLNLLGIPGRLRDEISKRRS